MSKIPRPRFSLGSGSRARRVRPHAEPGASQARARVADRADPRGAVGVRPGGHGHLSPRPSGAEPGHRRLRIRGAAHAHGLPVRAGRGPGARRPGLRRPRAPAAPARRPGSVHHRLAPVRGGPRRVVADRRAAAPGGGRSGGNRARPGDRARPPLGRRAGTLLRAADARERTGADPGPGGGRPAAPRDRLARRVRGAGGGGTGAPGGRGRGPPGDAPARAPPRRRPGRHAEGLRGPPLRPALRGLRAVLRPRVRGDVRLHRGIALRAPGDPRPLGHRVQPRVRRERGRDHGDERREQPPGHPHRSRSAARGGARRPGGRGARAAR